MQSFSLAQIKSSTQAGGIASITLRGDGAAFEVDIHTQRGERGVMVTSRQQPRRFADLRRALSVLKAAGWSHCTVDTSTWRPEDSAQEKTARPDRSVALKSVHEAADYDQWYRAKVQKAIDGLKDGTNRVLPQEEVQIRRARLIARVHAIAAEKAALAAKQT
jgi:hypothetical protein